VQDDSGINGSLSLVNLNIIYSYERYGWIIVN